MINELKKKIPNKKIKCIQPVKWQCCTDGHPSGSIKSLISVLLWLIYFLGITFCDLLYTIYLSPCRISSFEVKVESLYTGLRSDYLIINADLSSQPDVLRSDPIPLSMAAALSLLNYSCTAQVLESDNTK